MAPRTQANMPPPRPPPTLPPSAALRPPQSSQAAPPSSSLALVVQGFRGRPEANDNTVLAPAKDVFRQLMAELLGLIDGPPEPEEHGASSQEDDLKLHYDLCTLVTTNGLSVLLQDNPFESPESFEELLTLGRRSLYVIQWSLSKQPNVLSSQPPENSPCGDLPLGLWLVAKLLPLLCRLHLHGLADGIIGTLEDLFLTASKWLGNRVHLGAMLSYCQECVNAIALFFQDQALTKKAIINQSSELDIELPGPGFAYSPSLGQDTATLGRSLSPFGQQSVQFSVGNFQAGATLAARVLTLLCRLAVSGEFNPTLRCVTDTIIPCQQGVFQIWRVVKVWDVLPYLNELADEVRLRILEALDSGLEALCKLQHSDRLDAFFLSSLRYIVDILERPIDKINQLIEARLGSILLSMLIVRDRFSMVHGCLRGQLYPLLVGILRNEANWDLLTHDCQIVFLRVISTVNTNPDVSLRVQQVLEALPGGGWCCKDEALNQRLRHAMGFLPEPPLVEEVSPRKKIKLAALSPPKDVQETLAERVFDILGSRGVTDLVGLGEVMKTRFVSLGERDKLVTVKTLGLLACAQAGSLSREVSDLRATYRCVFCDSEEPLRMRGARNYIPLEQVELFTAFLILIDEESPKSTLLGCGMLDSIKRLLNHCRDINHLSLPNSRLASYCRSAIGALGRKVRIAAGRTLPALTSFSHDITVLRTNQVEIINYLRRLNDEGNEAHAETVIMAYGQYGRVATGEYLGMTLERLTTYLGHAQSVLAGVAQGEINAIATARGVSVRKLFSPYWRIIAYAVVGKLKTRPQIADKMAQLLRTDVDEFLRYTKQHTLPWLIKGCAADTVHRIAKAERSDGDTFQLCWDNMAYILPAFFVSYDAQRVEGEVVKKLRAVTSHFSAEDFPAIVRRGGMNLVAELLKAAGDAERPPEDVARIPEAIELIARMGNERPKDTSHNTHKSKKAAEKNADSSGSYFSAHCLGLCNIIIESLKLPLIAVPYEEKNRSLKALEVLVTIAGNEATNALPQICACLQSSMRVDELRTCAIQSWMALVTKLPKDPIASLLPQTFALTIHYWDKFDSSAQNIAQEMVGYLFTECRPLLKNNIWAIPPLGTVDIFKKHEARVETWRRNLTPQTRLELLAKRCCHENGMVVAQALVELLKCIKEHEDLIHVAAASEQPDGIVPDLMRCLLDVVTTFKSADKETRGRIEQSSAECLGLIGAVDPTLIEAPRTRKEIMVLNNFKKADETHEFVIFFLERILVGAFLRTTDSIAQGLLSWAMQELLKICQFNEIQTSNRAGTLKTQTQRRWEDVSESAREVLSPFLNSMYSLDIFKTPEPANYPIVGRATSYREWAVPFLQDLLRRARGANAKNVFGICIRILKGQDISIINFLFPFIIQHLIICGANEDRQAINTEFQAILRFKTGSQDMEDTIKHCCEVVFGVIDYLTRWLHDKREYNQEIRVTQARRQNRHMSVEDEVISDNDIDRVENFLQQMSPDVLGERSLQLKSYSRALLYCEQHIRMMRRCEDVSEADMEPLYQQLQRIYSQIDEPDGVEGISVKITSLDMERQVLENRAAGRWSAVQSWYELQLAQDQRVLGDPKKLVDVQENLISCLRDSGQSEALLGQIDGLMAQSRESKAQLLPYAVEASWITGNWASLEKFLALSDEKTDCYDVRLGQALYKLRNGNHHEFLSHVSDAREEVLRVMTETSTSSVRQAHDSLVKLHALSELDEISEDLRHVDVDKVALKQRLKKRLDLIGTYSKDKQYILALRRAVFELSARHNSDICRDVTVSAWLSTANLARKANQAQQAFNAIHHASNISGAHTIVENAKLLWQQGQTKSAIRNLEGAIQKNVIDFDPNDPSSFATGAMVSVDNAKNPQNRRVAKAHLLLAKWVDRSGRTTSTEVLRNYQQVTKWASRWERGHYYLGRYYNKLIETEKASQPSKQSQRFLFGELAKLVVNNYFRAATFGVKYIFQTIPRLLTLWMDLGDEVAKGPPSDSRYGTTEFLQHIYKEREKNLKNIIQGAKRYYSRFPAWMWFIAFPQIMSRITHPNTEVFDLLQKIIIRVVSAYPQQAMWSLLAVNKSTNTDRRGRGQRIITKLKTSTESETDLRSLINAGVKISDALLRLCNATLESRASRVSASRDLHFNHSIAPCEMVIPTQANLTVILPANPDIEHAGSKHNPFSVNQPTIYGGSTLLRVKAEMLIVSAFEDEVDIMNSLIKPRKITITGSDGGRYGILCKPKDDLRKDARLMEFNSMINRFLKKDPESRKRSLYIRTYAVTPLNEECGLIEWVNNVRTLRDIILKAFKIKTIPVDYGATKEILDECCRDSTGDRFTTKLLPRFPPVFHEWFLEQFSEPYAWFEARLRYTRTSAVMSMVGTILGLGDRHGENILFDTKTGDTLHVDFNCLFDKGLSFEKPERVPFRLTQNMVDAFGAAGYEGAFRKGCESAMRLLRHNQETMMTVLEAFIHDPAVDMVPKKVRRNQGVQTKVPDSPKEILENILGRLKGHWEGENIPLSVEGQVENLIRKAVDPKNLAAMYIGWCPMF